MVTCDLPGEQCDLFCQSQSQSQLTVTGSTVCPRPLVTCTRCKGSSLFNLLASSTIRLHFRAPLLPVTCKFPLSSASAFMRTLTGSCSHSSREAKEPRGCQSFFETVVSRRVPISHFVIMEAESSVPLELFTDVTSPNVQVRPFSPRTLHPQQMRLLCSARNQPVTC